MASKRKKPGSSDAVGVPGSESGYTMSEEKPVSASAPEIEAALKGINSREEDMVQLVNLTMGDATLWVPAGVGVARASVGPFQLTPPMPKTYAERQLVRPRPTRFDPQRYVWQPLPPPRPDGASQQSFVDKNTGQTVYTSTYMPDENYKTPSGKRLYHSINQAQHFLARLRTAAAIRRYVREFDPRPEVASYAALVIDFREKSRLDRMGLGATEVSTVMN